MVAKKKSSKPSSVKRKSTSAAGKRKSLSASTSKRRLGDVSLDWITDTIESETILPEAESRQIKTAGVSKETKIGLVKKYVSKEGQKKERDIKEVPPGILADSSTITKRKKGTVTKDKKIPVQYEIHEKELPEDDSARIKKSIVHIPEDSSTIVKKRSKAASQEEIISGETKIPSEKKETRAPAAAAKKEMPAAPKKKWMQISGMGESLKKGSRKVSGAIVKPLKSGKTKLRERVSSIIDVSKQKDSSTIVKKRSKAASQEEIISRETKIPSEKKETRAPAAAAKEELPAASQEEIISGETKIPSEKKETRAPAAADKEEMPATAERKWMQISGMGESLKKGSQKISGAIVKPLKSGKTKLRKRASSTIDVSKQPVKAISALDRKITRSTKKVVTFRAPGISVKSVLKNIALTDTRITKSAKKLMDSILD